MFRLWNRVVKMDMSRTTYRILLWDMQVGRDNWSSNFKDVCILFDLMPVYEYKRTVNIDLVTQRAMSVINRVWKEQTVLKPKLRTYCKFKDHFETEAYLTENFNKHFRSILCQLRIGILPLTIETGRFHGVPIENRTCPFCPDKVEDELHFVCYCPKYSQLRFLLYNSMGESFLALTTEQKFIKLAQSHQYNLAKFISNAWQVRQNLLYT